MTDCGEDAKLEVKQASKEYKESENVAEKYSAMTGTKNSDMNMNVGELSAAFTAVPTHKSMKKVRGTWRYVCVLKHRTWVWDMLLSLLGLLGKSIPASVELELIQEPRKGHVTHISSVSLVLFLAASSNFPRAAPTVTSARVTELCPLQFTNGQTLESNIYTKGNVEKYKFYFV